jgi:hypothetical protein
MSWRKNLKIREISDYLWHLCTLLAPFKSFPKNIKPQLTFNFCSI